MGKVFGVVSSIILVLLIVIVSHFTSGCSATELEPDNVFMELLGLLPAEAKDTGVYVIIDHSKWRELIGLSVHTSESERYNRDEYIQRVDEFFTSSEAVVVGEYDIR